jgi:hypothetical protein
MMMNWLHYLLEANLYLAVAYGCYWLLLRKQTFYTANRIYLLASTVLCFVIPLVQLTALQHQTEVLPPVQTTTQIIYAAPDAIAPAINDGFLTQNKATTALYVTPALSMLILFLIKLYSLLNLIFRNKHENHASHTLVYIDRTSTPFSFFGYLFVKDRSQLQEVILRHELAHIRQKHSWDIVFTELLKVINWFNPVIYLLQNSLKELHEFEADRCATVSNHQDDYVNMLISQAYQTSGVPFANHFSNQQLLKSRIMKLYQKRSGKLARLNYLMAVPLCAGLLCASTLAFSKNYGWIKINTNKKLHNPALPVIKTPVDTTQKKTRLKVTSGGVTGITDKLELKGNMGKKTVFTAQDLTAGDQKLLQNFGIKVELTSALATTTSILVPPPPPPAKSVHVKNNSIPPPPPPVQLRPSAKLPLSKGPVKIPAPRINTIKFPPPKVETIKFPAPKHIIEAPLKPTSDSTIKSVFSDMFKHLQRTSRYPKTAADNNVAGAEMASFKVDKDQHISDVVVKKGAHPALDAETIKNISSYNGTLQAKPGTYTMLIDYELDNGDGSRTAGSQRVIEQEIPTAGKVVVVGYGKKK